MSPPKWEQNFHTMRIQFLGTFIDFHTVLAQAGNSTRELQLSCYTGPGLGAGVPDTDSVTEPISAMETWTVPLTGSFSVSCEMEEVLVFQGGDYPTYGGAQVQDPPALSRAVLTDRLKIGSTLSVSASVGTLSVSASVVVDAARQGTIVEATMSSFTYPLTLYLEGEGRGKSVNVFGFLDLFINLGGNNAILTGSLSGSDAHHSVSVSGTDAKFNISCTQFTKKVTSNAVFVPQKELDFGLSLRAMEHAYPSTARFRVDRKLTELAALVTMGDGASLFITQSQHAHSAEFWQLPTGPEPHGGSVTDSPDIDTPSSDSNLRPTRQTLTFGDNLNEFCPFRLWLAPDWITEAGEQPKDWRTLLRGRPYSAFTLTQAAEAVVTSTLASGTGTGDLTIALPSATTAAELQGSAFTGASLRGYRYLRLRMKADVAETVKITIGTKEWLRDKDGNSLALTTSYEDFDIDLCSPTNETASVDDTDTFFPLPTVDGEYWGVSAASSIVVGNISAGVTVDVSEIKVVRDDYVLATFLQPYPEQWIPAGDTSEYPVRFLDGDTDGRRSMEGIHFYRPSGGGTPVARSLSDLIGSINGAAGAYPSDGWEAVAETVFPDGFHTLSLPACFAKGAGALYEGTTWTYGFDHDASGTLQVNAQSLWDSVDFPALAGDLFAYFDHGYSGAAVLRANKILRSQIVGLVFLDTSLPAEGILVSVNGGAAGTGTTEENGSYQTGLPYPKGGPIVDVSADAGPSPVPSGACVAVARRRERMCFRVEPGTAEFRAMEIDSPRAWLHIGVGKRIRTYHAMTDSVAFESEEYANVDSWKHLCVDSRYASLLCLGVEGGTSRVYVSEDGGLTGTETLTVTTTSSALKAFSEVGLVVFFFEDGAGVFRQESEDNGATWSDPEAVDYDGAQLDGTILDKTGDPRASDKVRLSLDIAGDTVVLSSEDYGYTFTSELS